MTNIELMSSKAAQLEAEATQGAIENAIVKASELAKAFGAELGEIYSINSNLTVQVMVMAQIVLSV